MPNVKENLEGKNGRMKSWEREAFERSASSPQDVAWQFFLFLEVSLQVFTTVINYFITVTVSLPPPPLYLSFSLLHGQVIHTSLIQDTFWLIVVSFAFTPLVFSLLEEIDSGDSFVLCTKSNAFEF